MDRVKTFDATGVAPNGRLYAGDLNMIQDAAAALTDLTQNLQVSTLAVGEAGLQISRYGAGEALISGALRASGILRGLGGMMAGTFTTAQRDAIAAGSRPYGLLIVNTTNNRYEWNSGTDAAPNWQPVSPPIAAGSIGTTELADGSVTSAKIADGTIVNADIAAGAAIAISKLAGFPNDATKHLKGDGTWDYVHGAEIAALTISDVHIAAAAAIAQTKIASVLGLASLSADINYFKGNSGQIELNDSLELLNGKGLYGKDNGGVYRLLAKIAAGTGVAQFGVDAGLASISIGLGQTISLFHATGNVMFGFVPSYWGGGLPGIVIYNSAGSELARLGTPSSIDFRIGVNGGAQQFSVTRDGCYFPGGGVTAGGLQNFTATPLYSADSATVALSTINTWQRVGASSISIPRAGTWLVHIRFEDLDLGGAYSYNVGLGKNGALLGGGPSISAGAGGGSLTYLASGLAAGDVLTAWLYYAHTGSAYWNSMEAVQIS